MTLPDYRIRNAASLVREMLGAISTSTENAQGNTPTNEQPIFSGPVFPDYSTRAGHGPYGPRTCVKCKKFGKVDRHHVTYVPEVIVDLCHECHSKITGLNSRAAFIAYTNKATKVTYTNRVRLIMWRWFISDEWPLDRKRICKTEVRNRLAKANLKIEVPEYAKKSRKFTKRNDGCSRRKHEKDKTITQKGHSSSAEGLIR